jgi:hypothetical protein
MSKRQNNSAKFLPTNLDPKEDLNLKETAFAIRDTPISKSKKNIDEKKMIFSFTKNCFDCNIWLKR